MKHLGLSFRVLSAIAASLSFVFVAACSSTPLGAVDPHLSQAKSRAPEGAQLFAKHCASCHGDRGQGLTGGPAVMGIDALPLYPDEQAAAGNPQLSNPGQVRTQRLMQVSGAAARDPFQTSADVYRYISTRMPKPSRSSGTLRSDEYWAILNFMLVSHGVTVPEEGVTEANASSVVIPH
jgi:mono/diheme cytochrome c family protein